MSPAEALVDARPDRGHDAGCLVAHDHGIRSVPAKVAVDIRAAHRARPHLEQHLAVSGHGVRDVAVGELPLGFEDCGLH